VSNQSERVPAGKYRARAVGGDFGDSSQKKTPYAKVPFKISPGQGEASGETVVWNGYFGENSTTRTIESLRFCGCTFPDNDVMNLEGIGANEVEVVVEHESYKTREGEDRIAVKVAWVNSLIGGVRDTDKMDAGRAAQFRNSMKASIALAKRGQGAAAPNGTAPRAGAPAQQPMNEDDIPF